MPVFHCSVKTAFSELINGFFFWKHPQKWSPKKKARFKRQLSLSLWYSLSLSLSDTQTHTHTPLCTWLHHQSTTLLRSSLIPGRGSSPRCLCLNSKDSRIIQTFHGTYLVPPGDSGRDGKCHHRPKLSLPPLSLLFNQALSVAHAATVVCCPSLGKCRPKWLLCAEAQTTGTQRGAAGAHCASRGSHSG